MRTFQIIKTVLTGLGGLALFLLGGKLNQTKTDKKEKEQLQTALNKAKEADRVANKDKANINTDNVIDKLNQL